MLPPSSTIDPNLHQGQENVFSWGTLLVSKDTKCWTVFISRDVDFHETVFPFRTVNATSTDPFCF